MNSRASCGQSRSFLAPGAYARHGDFLLGIWQPAARRGGPLLEPANWAKVQAPFLPLENGAINEASCALHFLHCFRRAPLGLSGRAHPVTFQMPFLR